MNAKIFVFVFCVEVIIYLLLYDMHDCTLQQPAAFLKTDRQISDFLVFGVNLS